MGKNPLTLDYLKSVLDYNFETGIFTWKYSERNIKYGQLAGSWWNNRLKIKLQGKSYYAHILAWFYYYGEFPKEFVDHKDKNSSNNKINNLRLASKYQNNLNTKLRKDNKLYIKNVRFHKPTNKYQVRIRVNSKPIFLGCYDDLELANLVAIEARDKFHGEFASHS